MPSRPWHDTLRLASACRDYGLGHPLKPYYEVILELAGFSLESSWVLDVSFKPGELLIKGEFVLTPNHAEYLPPDKGSVHCTRRGSLNFSDVTSLEWKSYGTTPGPDASGELDWGAIDSLEIEGHSYTIDGSFGAIQLEASSLTMILD